MLTLYESLFPKLKIQGFILIQGFLVILKREHENSASFM